MGSGPQKARPDAEPRLLIDVRVLALGDWKYTKDEKIAEAKRCVKSRMRRTKSRIRSV